MSILKFTLITFILSIACYFASAVSARYAGHKGDNVGKFLAESYLGSKDFAIEVAQELKIPMGSMTSVTVEVPGQRVKVQETEGEEVIVKIQGKVANAKPGPVPEIIQTQMAPEALKITLNEEALRSAVDTSNNARNWHFNVNGISLGSGVAVEIFLPKQIKNLEVYSTSGGVEFLSGSYEAIFAKATSGDIRIKDISVKEFIYELTSGDLDGKFDFESLKGEGTSGDIELKLRRPDPQIDIVATSGSVEISFRDEPNARVNIATSTGEMEVFKEEISGKSANLSFGEGQGLVQIRTSSGDVEIEKKL